jgi:hypothetical protein
MADLDALAGELAEGLIERHARSATPREVLNAIGDVDNADDLTDDEAGALVAMVLDRIEHADIEITINGG